VNALVSDALDPTSRMPEFKTCPVALTPHSDQDPGNEETPMHSTPRFLQGIFPFEGQGVDKPAPSTTR
jgi:assimilatory nitrate reductase catalytic subunit